MKQVGFFSQVLWRACCASLRWRPRPDGRPAGAAEVARTIAGGVRQPDRPVDAGKQTLSPEVWKELRSQSLERLRGALDAGGKASTSI